MRFQYGEGGFFFTIAVLKKRLTKPGGIAFLLVQERSNGGFQVQRLKQLLNSPVVQRPSGADPTKVQHKNTTTATISDEDQCCFEILEHTTWKELIAKNKHQEDPLTSLGPQANVHLLAATGHEVESHILKVLRK